MRTKRWNDPAEPGDGFRVLVCRYRPRGVRKEDETWDVWWKDLGPSVELHAAYWGKRGKPPIAWSEYRRRYLAEVKNSPLIDALADKVAAGEEVTLLCSSACLDPSRCHRSLLVGLVQKRLNHGEMSRRRKKR